MLQRLRSYLLDPSLPAGLLSASIRIFVIGFLCLCLPSAWSQGLQLIGPNTPFPATQVGATAQHNMLLQITGAPISITSFSFANSQGGVAEYIAGTVTGCVVDGTTINPVGTICTVPVTFQPAYPGLRQAPLKAVTSGGTFYFGISGTGQAAQVSLTPGTLSTLAGNGTSGDTGDNGAAVSATLNHPARTAVDSQGNVFIADAGNNAIREIVASTGNIVLVAGTGAPCATPAAACGDGGPATSANLLNPVSVAVDVAGNLFIADSGDNRIRRVDASTGIITTVAGNGSATYAGDLGQATAASIGNPQQVIVDTSGNLYIAAAGDNAVRYVSASSGIITTLAGDGTICSPSTAACGDGGTAAGLSKLNAPSGLALDAAGDLYIADTGDNRVRRIDATSGIITTVAGSGTAGYAGDNGAATTAELNGVTGVDVDAAGNLYIADTGNAAVRLVLSFTGAITTIAGSATPCALPTALCGDGGVSTGANLISPQNAALDSFGSLYIADSGENRIRKVFVVQPTFTFDSVTAGFNSPSNPESVLVTNIGNQALTANPPTSGTNPAFTSGFSYDGATSNCPLLTPSSTPATLPVGYGCTYGIDFRPVMAGTTTGSMTFTGNALNNPSAAQSVLLTGSATQIFYPNSLTSSNLNPAYGDSVTFTDTITVFYGIVPTGTVSFYNGATLLGTVAVPSSGIVTFTTGSLPVGTDTITAAYSGDVTYAPAASNAVVESVGTTATLATATTLSSSSNPSNYGQSVTLTATVAYPGGGAVPTGSVTFYAPGASTVINLQATPTSTTLSQTLNLAAGTYAVSVLGSTGGGLYAGWNPAGSPATNNSWTDRYGIELCATCTALVNDIVGDPGYATDAAALTAFQATASLNLTVDPLAQGQAVGNPYTFTLTAPDAVSFYVPDGSFANGAFTDTSSFADDTGGLSLLLTPLRPLDTEQVDSSGTAAFTTSTLPIGNIAVQAVYSGDNVYIASSSAILNQTVHNAAASGTLTTSNSTPALGQSVTFTDTLTPLNGTYPTGTVTFYNGSTVLGTGMLTTGVATLATAALPAGTDTITAVYEGDSTFQSGTSNAVIETVGKSTAADTLAASTATSTFGQPVTFTDTIPVVAGFAPTGTVRFYNGTAILGTGTVSASGIATLTTSSLPVGTDSITAVYSGDNNYASVTSNAVIVTVSKSSGADTLTTSASTATFGQAVTFTDTIPVVVGIAPTGTVTFYDGTATLGTGAVNTSGIATLTSSSLPVGTDSITAVYSGDSNYASVTSNAVVVTVAKASETGVLTASSSTSTLGQPITFTDTIPSVAGIAPTGTVTFYNGTTILGTGTVSSSGVATLTTSALPVGTDSITAVYSGDSNYASVTSNAVVVTVTKASETGVLTASSSTSTLGQPVTFTDTIPSVAGIVPTGTVTFYNGTTILGTGTVSSSGVATLTTSALPVGTDSITADYGGDSNYASATSNAITVTVTKASGTDTLTTSTSTSTLGQAVTFTDTVPVVAGIPPTGTVTFYNGTTILGTSAISASGAATLATSSLPAGTDSITAVYSGDSNYASVTSNAVTVTVAKAAGTNTLTASPLATLFGQPVTLTDTISSVTGTPPTGIVTFYNGITAIGTGTVNASGVSTLVTTTLPVGSDTLTAVYGGDSDYAAASSAAVTVTVAPLLVASTSVLTASSTSSTFGQAITFTDTVSGVSGATPGGTVIFYDGTAAIGTVPLNSAGAATLTTTTLSVGSHSITAIYSGDAAYLPGTSNAVTVTVGLGDFTIAVTPANQEINPGDSASYIVSLSGLTAPFNGVVVLSASGLPQGAVVQFSPASLVPGAGPTTATMTIATAPAQASLTHRLHLSGIGYALLFLPVIGLKRFRGNLRIYPKSLIMALLLLAGAGAAGALTGCGGGYFGVPHPYTITVTGTSGSLQHTTTITLTVRSTGVLQ